MTKNQQEQKFPYKSMPYKLVFKERDGEKTCYFECEEHRTKYIKYLNLKKNQYNTFDKLI